MNNIFFLITIVKRSDAEEYESFYGKHGVGLLYSLNCNGTAHERTLSLLGIEKSEKTMLFTIVSGETLKDLLWALTTEMKIDLPDRGVAVAIPLSSVGGAHTLEYFVRTDIDLKKGEEEMHSDYELIVAIYEKGFTDRRL
jgi:hypothetical protein